MSAKAKLWLQYDNALGFHVFILKKNYFYIIKLADLSLFIMVIDSVTRFFMNRLSLSFICTFFVVYLDQLWGACTPEILLKYFFTVFRPFLFFIDKKRKKD